MDITFVVKEKTLNIKFDQILSLQEIKEKLNQALEDLKLDQQGISYYINLNNEVLINIIIEFILM